jgi:hypothetical protein
MAGAHVFWEFGKYATATLFVLSVFRQGAIKRPGLPLLYFAFLMPSTVLTAAAFDFQEARSEISFNLSGPSTLAVSLWFFSHVKLAPEQFRRLFLMILAPAIGVGTVTLVSTLGAADLTFTGESNFVTSGGFGPNQVSAILGLGAMLAFLLLLHGSSGLWFKMVVLAAIVFLGTQSAMTFSRSGLYCAGGGALLAAVWLVRDTHARVRCLMIAAVMFVVVEYAVLPYLDALTDEALTRRFENTDSTGRSSIISADLNIWATHPLLGIGPGSAMNARELARGRVAAHTEFSRMLAEHGLCGLAALGLLVIAAVRNLKQARGAPAKAVVASAIGWSILFMLSNAMRLAAPAFLFGLSAATAVPSTSDAGLKAIARRRQEASCVAAYPRRPAARIYC